ncbi:MAG: hypothetical protein AAFW95_11265 [Cyanobacteria bacterium J06638_6]
MTSERVSHKAFDRAFAGVATVAVAAAIATGFWVLGTPNQQRLMAADRQRLQDLSLTAQRLHDQYIGVEGFQLPDALQEWELGTDPLTGQPYEYARLGDRDYELCATFDTDSSTHRLNDQGSNPAAEQWQHPAGRHCFEIDLTVLPAAVF